MSIASIDLNLLLVLNTVLAEQSVARAARRLHVTPSAVSNALARLRSELGDPLVTRKGRGIVPTARAAELRPIIANALAELERAITAKPFEPQNCTRTFTLACADAGQTAIVPKIVFALGRELPRARLRVVGIESLLALGDLASSEIDLQLGLRAVGPGIHSQPLLDDALVLVSRRRHPLCSRRLSQKQLGLLEHVAVEMAPGRDFRDRVSAAYARAGIARPIRVTVPSFAAAAAIAASTDCVATLPASLLAYHAAPLGLHAVKGPVPEQSVALCLSWHERTHADPATIAFRSLVHRAVVT